MEFEKPAPDLEPSAVLRFTSSHDVAGFNMLFGEGMSEEGPHDPRQLLPLFTAQPLEVRGGVARALGDRPLVLADNVQDLWPAAVDRAQEVLDPLAPCLVTCLPIEGAYCCGYLFGSELPVVWVES